MKPPSGGPGKDPAQKQKETARAMRRLVAAGFSSRAVWGLLRGWGAEVLETEVREVDVSEGEDV